MSRRRLRLALFAAALLGWLVLLRPAALGGPASYVLVSGQSMRPTLESGDLVLLRRAERYGVGDVVTYRVPAPHPAAGARVIHRITGGSAAAGFQTQGDNRDGADAWRPRPQDIEGRQWLRLRWAGKAIVVLSAPLSLPVLAGLLAFLSPGVGRGAPKTHRNLP